MANVFNKIKNLIKCYLFPKSYKGIFTEFDLTFIKKDKYYWYADIKEWTGAYEQLQMINGSDMFLDMITLKTEKDYVKMHISLNPFDNCYQLDLLNHNKFGATYLTPADFLVDKIWLCNVTHFIFGEHPEKIYFSIIE